MRHPSGKELFFFRVDASLGRSASEQTVGTAPAPRIANPPGEPLGWIGQIQRRKAVGGEAFARPEDLFVNEPIPELQTEDAGRDTDQVFPRVYEFLRDLARRLMREEGPGHTLQPTALVHEAYLRLARDSAAQWQSQRHFYGAAALAMRRILVERARRGARQKRGGGWQRIAWSDVDEVLDHGTLPDDRAPFLLAMDDAIQRFEQRAPRKAEIVKLRFYAGLKLVEIAQVLDRSVAAIKLDWNYSRAWLHREVQRSTADD